MKETGLHEGAAFPRSSGGGGGGLSRVPRLLLAWGIRGEKRRKKSNDANRRRAGVSDVVVFLKAHWVCCQYKY
jgi:hypothetical protein